MHSVNSKEVCLGRKRPENFARNLEATKFQGEMS